MSKVNSCLIDLDTFEHYVCADERLNVVREYVSEAPMELVTVPLILNLLGINSRFYTDRLEQEKTKSKALEDRTVPNIRFTDRGTVSNC